MYKNNKAVWWIRSIMLFIVLFVMFLNTFELGKLTSIILAAVATIIIGFIIESIVKAIKKVR